MSSKIKVDTIENVAGSGNVSLGSGHNLVVPGDLAVDTNVLKVDSSNNRVGINTTSPSDDFELTPSADGKGITLKTTGNIRPYLNLESNRSAAGNNLAQINFKWNGTNVAGIFAVAGADTSNKDDAHIGFNTASAGSVNERSRITSAGDLLVGTTTKETNGVTIYGSTANGFYVKTTSTCGYLVTNAGSGGSGTFMTLYTDTTSVGSITTNGSATAYNTSSDYRLKENVVTDWDATTRLKKLKPSRFNFKTDKDTTVDGFLAHEVSSIVPEAITGKKDAVDKDGNIEPQSIDQSKLVPLLVKTIQELEARVSVLESK